MLGATILIAMIVFAVWRKCCAQASHTAPAPMIAAPMPQPQPQPLPQPQIPPQMQPPQAPAPSAPAYAHHQNPTFNFSKPTASVLIYI
jgi:hypothetical protein